MSRITRREMLRNSTMIGFGFCAVTPGLHARAASPNEKLNVALIGIGGRGEANLKGVRDENIVALCDVDDERAGDAYVKFPKAKKFYDYRVMLEKMENEIDAVVVSTPDHTHAHAAMMAMRLGKHCYCEKPMAHSVSEVRAMTKLAREKGLATQLGVQRHTIDNVHRVVELVKSGAIGEVREVWSFKSGDRGMPPMPTDFPPVPRHLKWDLWLGPAQERPYSPDYCPYNWRFFWDFGTGETGNWGCHILDIPYWALGLGHPVKVGVTKNEPAHPQTTPKSMHTSFEFPARGDLPPVTLHWCHTNDQPEALAERGITGPGSGSAFIGEKGVLVTTFDKHQLFPVEDFADFQPPKPFIPDSPGFHEEWIAACKGGQPATCNFDYTGPMTETILLGNTAYRAGKGFDWDPKTMTAKNCPEAEPYLRPTFREGWPL